MRNLFAILLAVMLIAYQAEQLIGDAATAEYIARVVLRKIEDYPEICG